jgi:hypothetical protein
MTRLSVLSKLSALMGCRVPENPDLERFNRIMATARDIAAISPAGLRELVTALLRPMQAANMVAIAERSSLDVGGELRYKDFFFPLQLVTSLPDLLIRDAPPVQLHLNRDVVLPTPWNGPSYASALATIGSGKKCGPFRHTHSNPEIALVLPWGIAFVLRGNHSITAAILQGEGTLFATEVLDLSPLFKQVQCDGKAYREVGTGRILEDVYDPRRAAVFEIGRMMVDAGMCNKRL